MLMGAIAACISFPAVVFASDQVTPWAPIKTPDHRVVLCDARIGGKRLQALIDSGAGQSVLSPHAAARLGLSVSGAANALGLTGEGRGQLASSVHVDVAGRDVVLNTPAVYDLAKVGFAMEQSVDLVLGKDLFDQYSVQLDFVRRRIVLLERDAPPPPLDFARLPMDRNGQGQLVTSIRIDDLAAEAAIDLGSDVAAYVSPAFVREHRLLQGRPASQAASIGIEGAAVDTVFTLPNLILGSTHLERIPVRSPQAWAYDAPILVGMPVLHRFDLDFRASSRGLWLRPEPTLLAVPFRRDRSGLGAGWTGDRLQIAFVAPESPASAAGLRPGDVILRINGRPIDRQMVAAGVRFGAAPAGTNLTLDLADGRRIALVLADYY